MNVKRSCFALAVVLGISTWPPLAQAAITLQADDATNPAAFAPPLQFRSGLALYRVYEEKGFGNWREVNDRVRDAAAKRLHAVPTNPAPSKAGPIAPAEREHPQSAPIPNGPKQ